MVFAPSFYICLEEVGTVTLKVIVHARGRSFDFVDSTNFLNIADARRAWLVSYLLRLGYIAGTACGGDQQPNRLNFCLPLIVEVWLEPIETKQI